MIRGKYGYLFREGGDMTMRYSRLKDSVFGLRKRGGGVRGGDVMGGGRRRT